MARRTRSGTLVGPGIWRKCLPGLKGIEVHIGGVASECITVRSGSVRTVAPKSLAAELRINLAPQEALTCDQALDSVARQRRDQQRLAAWLFGAFGGLALTLAAVGLYSVVSHTVTQRTAPE